MSRTAMILGATGRVGEAIARQLMNDGWSVSGAARCSDEERSKQILGLGVDLFTFDVTRDDPATLPDAGVLFLEIWEPRHHDMIWPVNFYGVGRVVERYAAAGATIVNGCTINVYGDSPDPSDESTPCSPTNEYSRSRYAQERLIDYLCQTRGARGVHVRYAHANTATQGVIRRMAEKIVRSESLGDDPDARIQVIALEDFARVTIAAVERAATPPAAVNCCHPYVWTQRQLARDLHRRLGRGEVVFDRDRGGIEASAYASADRMIELFGEPRISLDNILQRVVDDMNSSPDTFYYE